MRGQKGITLVALLITIVVLMILAVVSISSMQENNIIERANQAKTEFIDEQRNENEVIKEYNTLLDAHF